MNRNRTYMNPNRSPIISVTTPSTEPATPPPIMPMGPDITISEVQRLSLKPDDIIVYEVDTGIRINDMQAHRIKEQLEQCFPGHQVVVVIGGHLHVYDSTEDPPLPV